MMSYGYQRAEILGALVSAVSLWAHGKLVFVANLVMLKSHQLKRKNLDLTCSKPVS